MPDLRFRYFLISTYNEKAWFHPFPKIDHLNMFFPRHSYHESKQKETIIK